MRCSMFVLIVEILTLADQVQRPLARRLIIILVVEARGG